MAKPKKYYLVIACTACNRLLLASSVSRTRTCPYCGRRVKVADARVIARSESPKEARVILQETKTQGTDQPKLS